MQKSLKAEPKRVRYFLEVFYPNVDLGFDPEKVGGFLNDNIFRCLAGVTASGRPVFLKILFTGPGPLEELVFYDPNLVVGILGGSAGTTLDAFQLIHDAQKYGAKAPPFFFTNARLTSPNTPSPSSNISVPLPSEKFLLKKR